MCIITSSSYLVLSVCFRDTLSVGGTSKVFGTYILLYTNMYNNNGASGMHCIHKSVRVKTGCKQCFRLVALWQHKTACENRV